MENEAVPVVLIETVEIRTRPAHVRDAGQSFARRRTSHMRGKTIPERLGEHPALIAIAGALLGYSLVSVLSRWREQDASPALTRRIAAMSKSPGRNARVAGDSLKRHGDRYASLISTWGEGTRAPTYPEG